MKQHQRISAWAMCIVLVLFAAGCKKKTPVPAAPFVPTPEIRETPKSKAPTISEFVAEPGTIERGQAAMLRWQVQDANEIAINPGIGAVSASGQRQVYPSAPTTYTLLAKGPGGSASAVATVGVIPPPPATTAAPAQPRTISERLASEVQDVYFDFDRSNIREDARIALTKDAEALKLILTDLPNTNVVVEGHCDERGSAEYNLALGDRRATTAKEFLGQLGVPLERLIPISYGKERPQCTELNEECWQKNRRVHFAPGEQQRPKQISQAEGSQ